MAVSKESSIIKTLHLFFSGKGHDSGRQLDLFDVIIPFQYQAAIHTFFSLCHHHLKCLG